MDMCDKAVDWNKYDSILKEKNLTNIEVTKAMGVGHTRITDVKSGRSSLTKMELLSLCYTLGCKEEDLILVEEPTGNIDSKLLGNELKLIQAKLDSMDKTMVYMQEKLDDLETEVKGLRGIVSGTSGLAVAVNKLKEIQEEIIKQKVTSTSCEQLILELLNDGTVEEAHAEQKCKEFGYDLTKYRLAKKRLGIVTITKGYGDNKKKYLELRRGV